MNGKLKDYLINAKNILKGENKGENSQKEYDAFFDRWNIAASWWSLPCKLINEDRIIVSNSVDTTFQILKVNNDAKYTTEKPIQQYYAFMNGRLLSPVGTESIRKMLRVYIVPLILTELANNRTYCVKIGNEDIIIDLEDYKEPLPGQDSCYQDLFEEWNEENNLFGGFEKIDSKKIILDYEQSDFRTIFQQFYCIGTETIYILMDGRLIGEHSYASVDKRDFETISSELEQKGEGWVLINSKGELIKQSTTKILKKEK